MISEIVPTTGENISSDWAEGGDKPRRRGPKTIIVIQLKWGGQADM